MKNIISTTWNMLLYLLDIILRHRDWNEVWDSIITQKRRLQKKLVDYYLSINIHRAFELAHTPLDVRELISKTPTKNLSRQDFIGYTILHHAILRSSDQIIKMLIDACPQATGKADSKGMTPLHFAIIEGRSYEVIKQLLIANPQAVKRHDNNDDSPLRIFFKNWNVGLRIALAQTQQQLNFSIANANIKEEQLLDLPIALIEDPVEVIISAIYNDYDVLKCVNTREILKMLCLLFYADKYEQVVHMTYGSLQQQQQLQHSTTTTTSSMMYPSSTVSQFFDVLRCCLINPSCPSSFVSTALQIHPTLAYERDPTDGNGLLHIAANAPSSFDGCLYSCIVCTMEFDKYPCCWYQVKHDHVFKLCEECYQEEIANFGGLAPHQGRFERVASVNKIPIAINDLLAINPTMASLPNNNHELPLHRAISQGKSYKDGGMEAIFRSAPDALVTRRISSHLYPFMEAATTKPEDGSVLQQFTTCFSLLMESPQLVSGGLYNNCPGDDGPVIVKRRRRFFFYDL